jgi:hypothetical protein
MIQRLLAGTLRRVDAVDRHVSARVARLVLPSALEVLVAPSACLHGYVGTIVIIPMLWLGISAALGVFATHGRPVRNHIPTATPPLAQQHPASGCHPNSQMASACVEWLAGRAGVFSVHVHGTVRSGDVPPAQDCHLAPSAGLPRR